MIENMEADKKTLSALVSEFFLRGTRLNISLVFILQSLFKIPENVRLNVTYHFVIKIPNKRKRYETMRRLY